MEIQLEETYTHTLMTVCVKLICCFIISYKQEKLQLTTTTLGSGITIAIKTQP